MEQCNLDIAKTFKPHTILLWRKVLNDPEADRILNLFPSANVKLIEHQRLESLPGVSMAEALHRGKGILMLGETSSFVGHFEGNIGSSMRCCPYHKLVLFSNGCPYQCVYCYLAFVYRKYGAFIKVNINYNTMFKQIRKVLNHQTCRADFNMGEMLDSLALDHVTNITTKLVPFFSDFQNGYLMLLTKSSNIDNLLALKANCQTVISWSLNANDLIKQYESGTASLSERIAAAKACQNHGYRIRFRIDPGILYSDWKAGYAALIEKILNDTEPENITLGMLRLIPAHLNLVRSAYSIKPNLCDFDSLSEMAPDGKLRYHVSDRIEFYKFLIDVIRSYNKSVSVSLCRESTEIWRNLKGSFDWQKCNCITW